MPFPLPQCSFENMRRILAAGYMSKNMVMNIAEWNDTMGIIGTNYERAIYGCISFFLELGLLERTEKMGYYQLTDDCLQLGKAIRSKENSNETRIWRSIVENHRFFREVIDKIDFYQEANGFMEMRKLKQEIIRLSE